MDCLITGLNFLWHQVPYEVFSYSDAEPMRFEESGASSQATSMFPYILVNIGSGVSILKVTGEDSY